MAAVPALQPAADPTAGAVLVALIASLFIVAIFGLHRWAGVGCAGIFVFLFVAIASSAGGTAGGIIGSMIVVLPLLAIVGTERWIAARKRRALEASARAHEAASRRQRSAVPADARLLGRAMYQGGIPTMTPGLEVDLLVAGSALWLAPANPAVAPTRLDASRLTELYVVDGTASVVLVLAAGTGRDQEVELAASASGIGSARQLYALLDAALPAHASSGAAPVPRERAPCGGCGAMDTGDGPRCRYCGRPVS